MEKSINESKCGSHSDKYMNHWSMRYIEIEEITFTYVYMCIICKK